MGIIALAWEAESTRATPPTLDGIDPPNQAGVVDGSGTQRSPQEIVKDAVRALESQNSVSAKISQEINLFGKKLIGSGGYLEQQMGDIRLMWLSLTIQLGDDCSSLLQVCDGRFLWTRTKSFDSEQLRRIDVISATKALEKAKRMPPQGSAGILHSLGGLCKLMQRLHDTFVFTSVQPGLLKMQSGQLPVWQLRGRWKPGYVAKVLPEQKETIESGKPADLSKLPRHLPDHVLLTLGQVDLFPYRIEYRRADGKGGTKPLVTIHLSHVTTNVPIDPNRFQYNPGDMKFEDETDLFLRRRGVKRE